MKKATKGWKRESEQWTCLPASPESSVIARFGFLIKNAGVERLLGKAMKDSEMKKP